MAGHPPRRDAGSGRARLATGQPISGYIGFDPSFDSLHAGHLVPIFGLLRLQRSGGRPIAVVGGGTGMIGDPSGSSTERNLLDRPTLESNVAAIRGQLERFLDFSPGIGSAGGAAMVNNLDWLGELSLIDFLRDTGKHFTVPYMLGKDSVQVRLDRGLSFTEFSYMLLQAYDFWHLHRTMGVELQMGGADQWGNITAGLELIRRTSGVGEDAPDQPAQGSRTSCCCSPSGTKFGKSVSGDAIWLDPAKDVAVRVLPVLAQRRRSGCRHVPALVHGDGSWRDRAAGGGAGCQAGGAWRAAGIGPRHHGPDARGSGRRPGRGRQRGALLWRTDPGSGAAGIAVRVHRWIHVHVGGGGGRCGSLARRRGCRCVARRARRLIAGGGLTVNGSRVADAGDVPELVGGEWLDVRIGKRRREIGRLQR